MSIIVELKPNTYSALAYAIICECVYQKYFSMLVHRANVFRYSPGIFKMEVVNAFMGKTK